MDISENNLLDERIEGNHWIGFRCMVEKGYKPDTI